MNKVNDIVLFETEDREVKLTVPIQDDTVWLNRNQMSDLFGRDVKTIGKHINNALKEELDKSTVANFATVQNEGGRNVERSIEYYNLEMIISVGYRVKSQRGIEFRRWANKVLKDYIIKGYAVNDKRLQALQKTVEIQAKMLATAIEGDSDEVLKAVNLYTQALTLLDQYDHQSLEKPEGNQPIYRITYADCRAMVNRMEDSFKSDIFGVEKESGKIEGILAAVYQDVFGGEVYPSLEEKAAKLLNVGR
ncbi:MAG: virulence RhuM family protein [Lachnospiraceae bacterium]|nr:virulence RhuM family protein [Lachnospiraceae bacterium]